MTYGDCNFIMEAKHLVILAKSVVYYISLFGYFLFCETSGEGIAVDAKLCNAQIQYDGYVEHREMRKENQKKLKKASDVSKEGLILTVEHAVSSGSSLDFKIRGEITLRNIKGVFGSYKDNDGVLSKEFRNSLADAAYQGNFYHIRIAVHSLESEESKDPFYISTFIKACSLLQSNFSDIIKLNVDHTGQIFAVGLSTTTADCSNIRLAQFDLIGQDRFNTTVVLSHVTPGPVPETQTYIKKLEDERREKAEGKGKDNRSFFAKYWMYIVPLVIFLMLSSQEPPAGGAAGGGGGGGDGGAAAN